MLHKRRPIWAVMCEIKRQWNNFFLVRTDFTVQFEFGSREQSSSCSLRQKRWKIDHGAIKTRERAYTNEHFKSPTEFVRCIMVFSMSFSFFDQDIRRWIDVNERCNFFARAYSQKDWLNETRINFFHRELQFQRMRTMEQSENKEKKESLEIPYRKTSPDAVLTRRLPLLLQFT